MNGADRYDVIVIGAGHNGLVCGTRVARAGLRTLILERRSIVGGACVTEELWSGYHVSTTSYVLSMFPGKIIDEFDLKRYGFELIPTDNLFVPFEDGTAMIVWDDMRATCKEIAAFSEHDAQAYPEYCAYLGRAADFVRKLLWDPPPSKLTPRAMREGGSVLWKMKKMGREAFQFVDLMTMSAYDFLSKYFESDKMIATLGYMGSIGNFMGPKTPGSAYVLLHHNLSEHSGAGGWGFVRGGMGGLTQALKRCAEHHGATIKTDSEIKCVDIVNGRAVGVTLSNGDSYRADQVVSNADPKTTYLRLVGRDNLDADVVREVDEFDTYSTAFKINMTLDRLPEYAAWKGQSRPAPAYVHIGPSVEYLEKAYDDAKYGRPSKWPWTSPVIPTMHDNTLAPKGKHIMTCFGGHAPYTLADGEWTAERKEAFADRVIEAIERFAPGLSSSITHRQILMPPDLERIYGLPQGHIFHGELTLNQMYVMRPFPGYADYRTPVKNLYMCGSGTHPGGGVFGVPGYNAASEMLRDRRRGRLAAKLTGRR
jgi:phytoene dehydrogenase-like protein